MIAMLLINSNHNNKMNNTNQNNNNNNERTREIHLWQVDNGEYFVLAKTNTLNDYMCAKITEFKPYSEVTQNDYENHSTSTENRNISHLEVTTLREVHLNNPQAQIKQAKTDTIKTAIESLMNRY